MPSPSGLTLILLRSFAAIVLVAIATVVQFAFLRPVGINHPFLSFYPAVAMAALYFELSGGLTATLFSALAADYFLMEPRGQLFMRGVDEQVSVAVFILEGFIISYAAERIRRAKGAEAQARIAREREQAAAQLQESEQRLRLALEGGQMGMWTLDAGTGRSEWNDQEYELLGLSKGDGEETAEVFFRSVHPEDAHELRRALDEAMAGRTEYFHEFRIIRPNGEIRWLVGRARLSQGADGKTVQMRGVNYDITSLKLAQEELRRSEAEARARADELAVLMDTVPAFTFIAHDPECRSMSGSRRSRELLHVSEGMSVSASAPEGERATTFRAFKDGRELSPEELPVQRAAKGEEIRDFELTFVFTDGTSSDIVGDAVPLFDDAGKVRGAIGAFLDITERKKIQRELQKAHDELGKRVEERTAELSQAMETLKKETEEKIRTAHALNERDQLLVHQSRLAAMGEMISNIAHQWRQPLNVMGLIIQEMPMMYKAGEFSEEYLNCQVAKAKDVLGHMSQTIEDFRNFFRPSTQKQEFLAREIISKTLDLVGETLKNLQITVEVETVGDPIVYGYLGECCQVLLNILLNARDAFLESTEVTPRSILLRTFTEEEKTVITIADNAGGVPEEIIHKIFDPYFTTKGPDKGTGIGLSMAKEIIEKHMNGRFTARNVDHGAEFRIELDSKGAAEAPHVTAE
jgi:PAS domain S-box-containing protein